MTWNISVWDSSQGFDQYYVLRQDTSPQTLPLFTKRTLEVAVRFFFLLPNPAFQFQGLHSVDVYQKWMSRKLNLCNTSKIAIENKNQP